MAWTMLPTNYTDAVWSGLRKYTQIDNDDGTVSFSDVTEYSNKEKSFFGSSDANRMNEAINAIMSALENGTDLYEVFREYFATQETLFATEAEKQITDYTNVQSALFTAWFESVKDQLSTDVAGNLQNAITELDEKLSLLEHMVIANDVTAPLVASDGVLLVDDLGYAILADWQYASASEQEELIAVLSSEEILTGK